MSERSVCGGAIQMSELRRHAQSHRRSQVRHHPSFAAALATTRGLGVTGASYDAPTDTHLRRHKSQYLCVGAERARAFDVGMAFHYSPAMEKSCVCNIASSQRGGIPRPHLCEMPHPKTPCPMRRLFLYG